MTSARWARTARGWCVAIVAGLVSAALHASAGGSFPAPAVLALAVLLSGLAGTALIGASITRVRLAVSVAASQLIFHTTFTLFGTEVALPPALGTGHAHGAVALPDLAPAAHHAGHDGHEMLGAHVVAGAVTALLVLHADRALRTMGRPISVVVRHLLSRAVPLPALPRRASVARTRQRQPRAVLIASDLTRRGPPASFVTA